MLIWSILLKSLAFSFAGLVESSCQRGFALKTISAILFKPERSIISFLLPSTFMWKALASWNRLLSLNCSYFVGKSDANFLPLQPRASRRITQPLRALELQTQCQTLDPRQEGLCLRTWSSSSSNRLIRRTQVTCSRDSDINYGSNVLFSSSHCN